MIDPTGGFVGPGFGCAATAGMVGYGGIMSNAISISSTTMAIAGMALNAISLTSQGISIWQNLKQDKQNQKQGENNTQASNNASNEPQSGVGDCGYEEGDWYAALPLTKDALFKIARQYTSKTGGGLEHFAGELFENAFSDWQKTTVLGLDYDSKPREYPTAGVPGRQGVEPDGTRGVKLIYDPRRPPYYPHLSWFEVKQATVGKSIGKTSYDNQIWGHFSALSIEANTIGAYKFKVKPVLTIVTTAGVKLGPSLKQLEKAYKVDLYHQVAYYYKKCGNYYIGFGVPTGRNNPVRLIPPSPAVNSFVSPRPPM